MKRFIAILVALSMLCCMLVSCSSTSALEESTSPSGTSGKTATEDPIEITYWFNEDNEGTHAKMLLDRWEEYCGGRIKLNLEPIPANSYYDKLITAISTGTGPDVFLMWPSYLPTLVDMDALVDLTDAFSDWEYMDEVSDTMLETAHGGYEELYSFPRSAVVMYLYCRADMFEAAGLNYPTTMNEFYEACKELTMDTNGDGTTDVYGFGMRGARNGNQMWSSFVFNAQPDGDYYDTEKQPQMLKDEIIAANQKYIEIYKNGWAPPTSPTDGFGEISQNFKSGVTAMLYHHIGSSAAMKDALGENVVAVPVPASEDGTRYGVMEVTNLGVNAASQNQEAAIEFIQWLSSPEIQDIVCTELQQVPWLESVQSMEKYSEFPLFEASIDSLGFSHPVPTNAEFTPFSEEVWPQTFQRALTGEITSQEMMEILQDTLTIKDTK